MFKTFTICMLTILAYMQPTFFCLFTREIRLLNHYFAGNQRIYFQKDGRKILVCPFKLTVCADKLSVWSARTFPNYKFYEFSSIKNFPYYSKKCRLHVGFLTKHTCLIRLIFK